MNQMAVTNLNPTGESGKRLNVRNRTRASVDTLQPQPGTGACSEARVLSPRPQEEEQ